MSHALDSTLVRMPCAHAGGTASVAVRLWGRVEDAAAPVAVCVHGLTRNARDFDELALSLAPRWRVACIDMPGRGDSSWLEDPAHYSNDTYARIALALIESLGASSVHWVGTSMGGLLGMRLAASHPSMVASLVLNDVGAALDGAELDRQRAIAAQPSTFASLQAAEDHFRSRYEAFGIRSAQRWRHFTETSTEPAGDGFWRPRFDVRAVPAGVSPPQVDLWDLYGRVRCRVLVLRGTASRLLSARTCERMALTGPRANSIDIPGCGHAPDLSGPDRVGPVVDFLEAVR